MELEEKLTKLGFTQNPYNQGQWNNRELDVNIYVENGVIANNKSSSQEYLDEKNYYIHYLTKKNDLALKYNVFKKST